MTNLPELDSPAVIKRTIENLEKRAKKMDNIERPEKIDTLFDPDEGLDLRAEIRERLVKSMNRPKEELIGMDEMRKQPDPIEQIIAEMPKITRRGVEEYHKGYSIVDWVVCTSEAQCRLLAEKGYRLVPSKFSIAMELCTSDNSAAILDAHVRGSRKRLASNIHKWLMGNDG